jgi:hypothetical protein
MKDFNQILSLINKKNYIWLQYTHTPLKNPNRICQFLFFMDNKDQMWMLWNLIDYKWLMDGPYQTWVLVGNPKKNQVH